MTPQPGAAVLPLAVMRRLSPKGRREIATAIDRARQAERKRGDDE